MEFAELIKTTKVDHVVLSRPGLPSVKGTLCITSHHLLLSSQPEGNGEQSQIELWLLIRSVDAIEKSVQNLSWYLSTRTNGSLPDTRLANASGTITLKCKDLKILQLEIPGMEECLNIASSIEALSSVESVMMTYPFFYRPQNLKLEDGWRLHLVEEFYQQIAADTGAWRLSYVNEDFGACSSYPPVVIVPSKVEEEVLRESARFRHGGRFPILSYYHKKNGTVMLRSSQPLVGPNRKRCQKDELLLRTVLTGGDRGFVLETRSAQATKQARMLGGGTEHRSAYPGWKRFHRPLERGRPLQESFIKLVEACNDPSHNMDRWLSKLEASKWLYHVKEALSTACLAAQCMDREEACVLVHGAEGTDTTLLVTALAQVILDPNCRTITGFQGLLEREWIQAGHPFCLRCAHSAYSHVRLKHEAPTFLLFLDCVWQLGRQFPLSLEFNEGFLLALFEHSYASPYGTFLCNNEKERRQRQRETTHTKSNFTGECHHQARNCHRYLFLRMQPHVMKQRSSHKMGGAPKSYKYKTAYVHMIVVVHISPLYCQDLHCRSQDRVGELVALFHSQSLATLAVGGNHKFSLLALTGVLMFLVQTLPARPSLQGSPPTPKLQASSTSAAPVY